MARPKRISKEKVDEIISQAKEFYFNENKSSEENSKDCDKLVELERKLFGVGNFASSIVDNLVLMRKSNTTIYKVLNVIGYIVE